MENEPNEFYLPDLEAFGQHMDEYWPDALEENVAPDAKAEFQFSLYLNYAFNGNDDFRFQFDYEQDLTTLLIASRRPVTVHTAAARRIIKKVCKELYPVEIEHRFHKNLKIDFDDSTNLSGGRGPRPYFSPEDRSYFRELLRSIPSLSGYGDILSSEEMEIWRLCFDPADYTQEEVAQQIGKSQQAVSKFLRSAAAKFNVRFVEQQENGVSPPIELEAFTRKIGDYDPAGQPHYDFQSSFELFCRCLRKYETAGAAAAHVLSRQAAGTEFDGITIRAGRHQVQL